MTSVRLRKPGHHPLVRNGIHLMIHKYQETKKSYLKLRANILRARGARTLFQCSLYAWDRVATQHVFLSVGPKKKKKNLYKLLTMLSQATSQRSPYQTTVLFCLSSSKVLNPPFFIVVKLTCSTIM